MKDAFGYPLAGVDELKERISELEAQLRQEREAHAEAERLRLYNLNLITELGKDNSDWQREYRKLEAQVAQLQTTVEPIA